MEYLYSIGIFAAIWAVLVLSLNVLLGYGGQVSLGHAALFGIGAYTAAVTTTKYDFGFVGGLLAAMLVTAAIGAIIGLPSLRVQHDFLVLVTIGINFIFIGVVSYTSFLGGTLGIVGIPPAGLFGHQLSNWQYLLFCLFVLVIVMYGTSRLPKSWGGIGLLSLRDDEEAASSIGVSPARYKIIAFTLAGAIAGIGGALYAPFVGNVSPGRFNFIESVTLMSMLVFGGLGTVRGAVFGAVVLKTLPELLRGFSEYRFAVYGAVLLLSILFMPQGILGHDTWLGRRIDALLPSRRRLAASQRSEPIPERLPIWGGAQVTPSAARAPVHVLSANDITVDFGGLRALNSVSIEVRSGEILGLLGPNGAGKTTLFNAIVGAVPIVSGRITVDGKAIQSLPPHRSAMHGVVRTFQIVRPFQSMSVLGNVIAGVGSPNYPRMRAFMQGSNDKDLIDAESIVTDVGLHEFRDKRTDSLPVGLLRRLEVGRALATGANVLLLDEPAAGLTHAETEELSREIRRIADSGKAVILVEHNMRFALGLCDRVAVLASGELIASGSPKEIVTDPRVISAYLGEDPV